MDYVAHVAIVVAIYSILGISLNLLLGYSGLMSMAHGAFFGVGAYASALILLRLGVNYFAAMAVAIIVSMIIAGAIAIPALRTRSDYLVLLTLGFQVIIFGLMSTQQWLTQGPRGLSQIPRPEIFGLNFTTAPSYLPFIMIMSALSFAVVWRITHSPFGRMLKAMREDEDVALSFGKDVVRLKVLAFMMAGGIAAVAGSLFASYTTYINPLYFKTETSVLMIAIVALGGLANLWGTVLGALLLVIIPEILTFWVNGITIAGVELTGYDLAGPMQGIIYGLLLVLFMRFRPEGMIPEYMTLGRRKTQTYTRLSAEERDRILWGSQADPTDPPPSEENQKLPLEVNALKKSFGGLRAVDDLTLTLPEHRITALIGPNGAGKTTAYNLITNFLNADAGKVHYRGRDITKYPPHRIAHLGVVRSWQGTRVFNGMSVLENVLAARPKQIGENLWCIFFLSWMVAREEKENRRYAMACLDFVGLGEKSVELAGEISHAEQKMLQIACLLATEAEVLLLDEPVSGVDPKQIDQLLALVRKLVSYGKTICVVEHNLDVVKNLADYAYFLDQGHVVAKDTPAALIADPKLADLYFGSAEETDRGRPKRRNGNETLLIQPVFPTDSVRTHRGDEVLLEVKDLKVGYGQKPVVHGISINVQKGEIVTIFGHNGAGKSTTLMSISGFLKPWEGEVFYGGSQIAGRSPIENVQNGLIYVPQERAIFPSLSVKENLEMGAFTVKNREDVESRLKIVLGLFPVLEGRARQRADTLSGGERRMMIFGMALMTQPQLLMLDEPSLGLAPILVQSLIDTLRQIRDDFGTTVILVEQNVKQALRVADRVYVMKMGSIILEECGAEFRQRGQWWDLF